MLNIEHTFVWHVGEIFKMRTGVSILLKCVKLVLFIFLIQKYENAFAIEFGQFWIDVFLS